MTINKENVFYKHRMEIKRISEKFGGDIHVASRQWALKAGIKYTTQEMDEWNKMQVAYIKHPTKTLADLFQ